MWKVCFIFKSDAYCRFLYAAYNWGHEVKHINLVFLNQLTTTCRRGKITPVDSVSRLNFCACLCPWGSWHMISTEQNKHQHKLLNGTQCHRKVFKVMSCETIVSSNHAVYSIQAEETTFQWPNGFVWFFNLKYFAILVVTGGFTLANWTDCGNFRITSISTKLQDLD